jgi:YidC/Oxa1 family membrane protein insertase
VPTSSLETLSDVVTSSNLAEPAFTDIGLAGISPSGLIQSILEWLHIGLDLPWWGCIAIGICIHFSSLEVRLTQCFQES